MNRISTIFILIIFLMSCTNSIDNSTDLERMNLKGSVRSIDESIHSAAEKFGEIKIGELINSWKAKSKYEFNSDGNLTTEKHFYSNGNISGEEEWVYDNRGNLIEKQQGKSFGGGSMEIMGVGTIIVLNTNIPKYVCYYNKNELLKEIIFYEYPNKLFQKAIYEYDDNNLLSFVNRYNSKGERIKKYAFKYHPNGKLKEKINYSKDGKISLKGKFDTRGYQISSYNMKLISEGESVFKNDTKGRVIEEKWFDTKETHTYEYNTKGNRISFVRYDNQGKIIYSSYSEYEYDKNGNWVKKVKYENENKEVESVTKRDLTYY